MMLGRFDCGPRRNRHRDTDAEMAIGPAERYPAGGPGKAQDALGLARAPQTTRAARNRSGANTRCLSPGGIVGAEFGGLERGGAPCWSVHKTC